MISLDHIRTAAADLGGRVHRTPLLSASSAGEAVGVRLWIKAECLQKTGSFKPRGVLHRMGRLTHGERARGVVTISAGNHAQAVAWAATQMGVHATVVMPEAASPAKVRASRAYGAEVVLHGDINAAFARMEELREAHAYTLIHPFDDPHVIAGQGTVGLEIAEELPDVAAVLVPVGGGGLLAGVATAVKTLCPGARVYGVEPEGADALSRSLEAGRPVRLERVDTIADGLGAPMTGEYVLEQVHAHVDGVVRVSDAHIAAAMATLMERTKLLVEPAGAAGYAALLSGAVPLPRGSRVVVVASGGNVDLDALPALLERAARGRGDVAYEGPS